MEDPAYAETSGPYKVPDLPRRPNTPRSFAAEDPIYLKGKYTGSDVIYPADAPYNPGKCQELNFIDYSKKQKK